MKQKLLSNHRKQGFTITELLIVIVVIAILAAISIASYNDMSRRASNARTIANIKQYLSAMNAYKANVGHYPIVPGEGSADVALVCLGYGYTDGRCGVVTGTEVLESADFMQDLQKSSGVKMTGIVNERSGAVGGESFTGAVYGIDMVDPKYSSTGKGRIINWIMEGSNQNCVISGSWGYNSSTGNTACEIIFEEYGV